MAITDQQRFEAIVDEHQTTVFRTLARLVGRSDRLEDLAQEVFLRLWRALPQFRGDAHVNT
ncbi:MAG TPA: sigma factor, partial [Bryobacteraceae bacterium]|nr:sigma factor [Bryobacteraceae bacterium]